MIARTVERFLHDFLSEPPVADDQMRDPQAR